MKEDKRKDIKNTEVDEELILHIMSGNQSNDSSEKTQKKEEFRESKLKEKSSNKSKKNNYEEVFLINRFPSGRNGKVVYIRADYHERLQRIVQLTREEKTTLYSYIDNILEQHFKEYGDEITQYFNERYKPIL